MADAGGRRRRHATVRFRVVAVAIAAVAVTFAVGGAALAWQLQRSSVNAVVDLTVSEAGDVGSLLSKGVLPARLTAHHPGTAVQVVDDRHRVVSATPDLAGRSPLSSALPAPGTEVRLAEKGVFPGDDDPDAAVALGVRTPEGPRVVYVVATTEAAEDAVHRSLLPLAVVLLGLLAVTGTVAWLLVGRALRPVERIRSQVAAISGGDLRERVDEPPTDDEIGRLARTMNDMLARIQSAADRQAQFVSDASHELRSPLAALLTELEVARRRPSTADWPAVAAAAIDDGTRLQRIVEDLLLLARSDEDHLMPRPQAVDLDELALAEGERVRSRGRVAVDLHDVSAVRITGDPDLLRRLVRNLVENAERHAATTVRIGVAARGRWATVVVADDGPGIPVDKREWVFERFARLDDGRGRRSGGTGLGLAIAGEIARAHHGSVRIADSDVGTRMEVRLPREEEPAGRTGPSTTDRWHEASDAPAAEDPPTARAPTAAAGAGTAARSPGPWR